MKDLEEKRYIVAFLDLLGASKIMGSDRSQEVLAKIKEVFENTRRRAYEVYKEYFNDIRIVVFSDNIAFVRKIPEKYEIMTMHRCIKIMEFISFISIFLGTALEKELLFRGGVTIGKLYVDERMIWGKALVDAHDLERKVAIFPRVVISKELYNWMRAEGMKWWGIKQDFDGVWFIDILSNTGNGKDYLIRKMKKLVEQGKRDNVYNESVLQKYEWLERYVQNEKNCEIN
ncbi:MAG: hypothetical protein IIX92_00520 [Selenomonadales bacterium]|nr:hypothetical protein [Selenomonadales bacterium]